MNPALLYPFPGFIRRRSAPARLLTLWLAITVTALVIAGCGSPSDAANTNGDATPAPDANPVAAADFRIRSELVFSTRASLSFPVPGEVGVVNVALGDTVTAGDVLATLDTESLATMERAAAQAAYDLDTARDRLDAALGLRSEDPLVRARAESALAQAESALAQGKVNLDNAQERLDDFQLQYSVNLGNARKSVADAEAGLDQAEEALSDFAAGHSERFAQALATREQAVVALDAAEDALDDFLPDYNESLSKLNNDISTTEQNLDQARDALRDLDINHAAKLSTARQMLAQAETDRDAAEDTFAAFQLRAIENGFRDLSDGQNFDVIQFNALQSAADTARQTVKTWEDEVAELEAGPKEFDRAAAANRVRVLEDQLARLRRTLKKDESEGPDQNRLAVLQANVTAARERLSRADRDLAEAEQGVDRLELARLRAVVGSGRLALDSARNQLARLEAGPDQAELAARQQAVRTAAKSIATAREARDDLAAGPDEAAVALARSEIDRASVTYDSAQTDLEKAILRAPFNGVVRLLTISPGDVVTVDARVMQIVDPTDVTVLGLVETNYIDRIGVGTAATVTIGALPETVFNAAVREAGADARTERGIISYPVVFDVTVPPGVSIPPNPGLITTTVIP